MTNSHARGTCGRPDNLVLVLPSPRTACKFQMGHQMVGRIVGHTRQESPHRLQDGADG